MPGKNKIKNFTAADIEKYHKNLLSPAERHDMEKAALEDSFLADALEGYAINDVNISGDIAELKERLSEKIDSSKVIPFIPKNQSAFSWWRVAAIIVLVAGAGFLAYQFAFNKKPNEIAVNKTSVQQPKMADSSQTFADSEKSVTEETKIDQFHTLSDNNKNATTIHEASIPMTSRKKVDSSTNRSNSNNPSGISPSKDLIAGQEQKNEEAKNDLMVKSDEPIKIQEALVSKKLPEKDYGLAEKKDNKYKDSQILNGKASETSKPVILKTQSIQPEPAEGWSKYESYLADSIRLPESRIKGIVELSFEISKDGAPINFKIEKSLCADCDKEAIRLVREGPKWKPATRNNRASVTVSF